MIENVIFFIVAYLIGSINTSIIISKIMIKDDIRNYGSGNAGATNALRTLGKKGAAMVVAGDALKAVIAILLAKFFIEDKAAAVFIAGMGTVLGHNFPVFFGFKGGKGVLVSLVTMLFADWRIGIIVAVFAIAVMAISRYVSLGSIVGALLFVAFGLVFHMGDERFIVFSLMISGLAIYMHRSNIVRLIKGTENKLGAKKED